MNRKVDYALRLLRALQDQELHTTSPLCALACIPKPFAHKILNSLHKANVVQNIPGARGGSRLIADLGLLSLYDLMQILDERESISPCLEPAYQCEWRACHESRCMVCEHLRSIQAQVDSIYRAKTIASLFEEVSPSHDK